MSGANDQGISSGKQYDYLDVADTAGRPMALASILFTLLFIGAIALLLFSVGRWAYNQFIQNDNQVATTSEQATDEAAATNPDGSTQTESTSGSTGSESGTNNTNNEASTGGTNSESSGTNSQSSNNSSNQTTASNGNGTTNSESGSTTSTSSNSSTSSATPTTGASSTEAVPNTGPESVLGLFVATVILGTIAHNRWVSAKR